MNQSNLNLDNVSPVPQGMSSPGPSSKINLSRRNSFTTRSTILNKYTAEIAAVKQEQEEAQENSFENLRIETKKWLNTSEFGRFYENCIVSLSVLSSLQFLYQTYTFGIQQFANERIELIFALIFGLDWTLNILLADHTFNYFLSFFSMVDVLTMISIFVCFDTHVTGYPDIKNFRDGILYILKGIKTVRILRALTVSKKLIRIEDAVQRYLGEMSLAITMMILFFSAVMQYLESQFQPYEFHTWTYYIWVTIATVGYGDISPQTTLGRFAAMAMIGFAIVSIPKMTNELIEKMNLQSVYMRAMYSPKSRHSKHIVVCGDLSSTSLNEFFEELFHEDHENVDLSAVILLPIPPTVDIIFLLRNPKYFLSLTYLEGSALVDTDLKRAKAESAMAIFIMTNKFSSNPDEEDAKSILLSLSIKRYVSPFYRPSMLYCMQLIRPENRRHLSKNEANELEENDLVVCLNEIKMGAMAKAAMYPGSNTLLLNLISSFSDDALSIDDAVELAGEFADTNSGKFSSKLWMQEYMKGCGWEIYTTPLSEVFEGAKFSELSYALYDKIGVVLFAIQITDYENGGHSKVLLNPANFKIPNQGKFGLEAFVIAQNQASSDLSFNPSKTEKHDHSAVSNIQSNLSSISSMINITKPLSERVGLQSHKVGPVNSITSIESDKSADTKSKPETERKSNKNLTSRWNKLKRAATSKKTIESIGFEEILHKVEDEHFNENYYIRNKAADLREITIKTNVFDEIPNISNHLIIIGKGLRNLYDLIRPLRAKYLGPLRFIVLLYPDEIPHDVWQRINIFDAIIVVRGSPLEESHLRRAGIFRASQVVVLADGSMGHNNSSGMEALVDSDAIFSYQHVKRMNPNAQVVVEIVNQSNIGYLAESSGDTNLANFKFSPQFASGTLFTTSSLDSIICQTYYNPQIIKVVNKLLSGIDQIDRSDIAIEAGRKFIEQERKNSTVDSNSDSDSNSNDDESRSVKAPATPSSQTDKPTFSRMNSTLNIVQGSCLYQMNLPDDLPKKTYGSLYQHLATQGIIPLGLLRGTFANMNMGPKSNRMPYVFTNPDKDTELYACDRIFVLSPKPVSLNKSNDIMEWINDLQMRKSFSNFESRNDSSKDGLLNKSASGFFGNSPDISTFKEIIDKLGKDITKKLETIDRRLENLEGTTDKKDQKKSKPFISLSLPNEELKQEIETTTLSSSSSKNLFSILKKPKNEFLSRVIESGKAKPLQGDSSQDETKSVRIQEDSLQNLPDVKDKTAENFEIDSIKSFEVKQKPEPLQSKVLKNNSIAPEDASIHSSTVSNEASVLSSPPRKYISQLNKLFSVANQRENSSNVDPHYDDDNISLVSVISLPGPSITQIPNVRLNK